MSDHVKSKEGSTIEVGDKVTAPYRGGEHVGEVEEIAMTDEDAKGLNAKGASKSPAVAFHDQNDKKVAHKPATLTNLSKDEN